MIEEIVISTKSTKVDAHLRRTPEKECSPFKLHYYIINGLWHTEYNISEIPTYFLDSLLNYWPFQHTKKTVETWEKFFSLHPLVYKTVQLPSMLQGKADLIWPTTKGEMWFTLTWISIGNQNNKHQPFESKQVCHQSCDINISLE